MVPIPHRKCNKPHSHPQATPAGQRSFQTAGSAGKSSIFQSISQCHKPDPFDRPAFRHLKQCHFEAFLSSLNDLPAVSQVLELIRRLRRHVDWWLGERACSLSSLCCVRTIILVAKILSAWQSAARLVSAPPELRLAGRPGYWLAWRRSPGQWPPATNSSPLDRPSPYPP